MSSERGSADQPQGRMDRNAAREGDEAAFNRLVEPHLEELLTAARMEVQHRVALGDLGQDDLAPEELVGETLVRAWSDRGRRPALLGVKAWLLATLFRVSESLVRREARSRMLAPLSLEAKVPPEPIYDDDEEFWEWYEPDEMTRWEDVAAEPTSLTPEEVVEAEERLRSIAPQTRLVYLLHDVHHLTLLEVARALGITPQAASRLLAAARSHASLPGKMSRPKKQRT